MSFLITILDGIFAVWGWFRGNKDQTLGLQKQELSDDEEKLQQASDAAKIQGRVGRESIVTIDADLDKRVCRNPSDD